jgi:long-chain acyl-CoA synthetase
MTINPDPDKIHKPWLKHYDRHVPPSLAYPKETLPELFAASCAENAHRIALKFLGKSLSYAQVEASANAFAAYFAEQGVKKGDRVFLMLPNSPHFVIVYYAILKCGAVAVPASPLDTPTEAEYKFRNSGAKLVVFLDLLYDKVSALLQQNADIPAVAADVSEYLPFPKNMLFRLKKKSLGKPLPDFTRANLCTFGGVLREYRHRSAEPVQIAGSDTAVMIYTGGTTGVSKGVVLSHHAMVVNMTQARTWGDLSKNDIGLCVLPFFHGFGISIGLNLSLSSGGKMVLMPRWDEAQAIRHFEKDGITVFAGVPTMYNAMLNHKNFAKLRKANLRACFVGAAPVPEALKIAFKEKTGGTLIEGYGLTESVTAKCANPLYGMKKEKSIGLPWPDTLMAIIDEKTGELLPPDKEGEIILLSPDLMIGYWQNPEATAATIQDGWLYTGDIGRMDEDGYFSIVDRKKDLIITGGYNVYPAEIEEVLYHHPAVLEACVVGVKDDYLGEVGRAFVVIKPGMQSSGEEIRAYLADKLIQYKVPRQYVFKDSLPKSPVGKILRKDLRHHVP